MEWKLRELDDQGNPIEPTVETPETVVESDPTPEVIPEPVQEVVPEETVEVSEEPIAEEVAQSEPQKTELDDSTILSYLKDKYNKEYNSLDDVLTVTEQKQLPSDVETFLKYKEETGRGIDDYVKLQQDFSQINEQDLLKMYYKETKPHLDNEDVSFLIESQFSYDEELDDLAEIRQKKVSFKEELYKAKNHFESLKEKYKAPLESSEASIPENYKEAFNFYSEYKEHNSQEETLQEQRSKIFKEKTDSLFNEQFEGFEFSVGDKKQVFKPKDVEQVKEHQYDVANLFKPHLNEDGTLKDAKSYHKAIFAATNADALAKHFYEQGIADATSGLVKETKNIDMGVRTNTQVDTKGTTFRVVDSSDTVSYKIRKR